MDEPLLEPAVTGIGENRKSAWHKSLSVILLVKACDPLASRSIQPYINQLIGELDIVRGDQRRVGYYVGLVSSSTHVCLALSAFHWNRLSDRIGRKPVLLIALAGSIVSMLCLGLSRAFWTVVLSRCLLGLTDSNIGVILSTVGDTTDATNRARAFALVQVSWAVGASLGPMIGGALAEPNKRFSGIFDGRFWKFYPYFLPSVVICIIVALVFSITALFLEETAPNVRSSVRRFQNSEEGRSMLPSEDKPIPIRRLITTPVIVTVANYLMLEFQDSCYNSLVPLFLSMPIEIGGLGLSPARIGLILGFYQAFSAFVLVTYFAKVVRYFGERRVFTVAISTSLVLWISFPIMNLWARHFGLSTGVWMLIIFVAVPTACFEIASTCIFVFVVASAPNKQSLGATNGLAQMSVSVTRFIAPIAASSAFSFSVEHELLGGYAVFVVLFAVSCFAIPLARLLPHKSRPVWELEETEGREL